MAIGKSKRFQIFMRDQFTCQYCGNRPPDVVLEIDHIEAVANGGTDEDLNLITSCFDCNRGKSAKRLTSVLAKPDADLESLRVQQETAEIRHYLAAKKERDALFIEVAAGLSKAWATSIGQHWIPDDDQWLNWLATYSPEEIEYAIRCATKFVRSKHPTRADAVRYVSGIMKHQRLQKQGLEN